VAGGAYKTSGDGPATAQLAGPFGIALDSSGNLYFSESAGNRIRQLSNGVLITVAGTGAAGFSGDGGPATAAQLSAPAAIALDSQGALYIADWGNNRVRKVLNGVIATVAGNGTAGESGDGGQATSAHLPIRSVWQSVQPPPRRPVGDERDSQSPLPSPDRATTPELPSALGLSVPLAAAF